MLPALLLTISLSPTVGVPERDVVLFRGVWRVYRSALRDKPSEMYYLTHKVVFEFERDVFRLRVEGTERTLRAPYVLEIHDDHKTIRLLNCPTEGQEMCGYYGISDNRLFIALARPREKENDGEYPEFDRCVLHFWALRDTDTPQDLPAPRKTTKSAPAWVIAFRIEDESGDMIPDEAVEELTAHVRNWAAKRGYRCPCQFGPLTKEELRQQSPFEILSPSSENTRSTDSHDDYSRDEQ